MYRRPERLSARQAIVAIAHPVADWRTEFALPLLLDLLGEAVGVNGVNLGVCVPDESTADALRPVLPFGVELVALALASDPEQVILRHYAERGFSPVVFVAADAVGISARALTTALSVAALAGTVAGSTPLGTTYLAGLSLPADKSDVDPTDGSELLAALLANREPAQAPARSVEPRFRLSELPDLEALRQRLEGEGRTVPRTLAQTWVSGGR